MPIQSSRISGFHKLSMPDRLAKVIEVAGLDSAVEAQLSNTGNLDTAVVDSMIENAIGTMNIPLGIATNMIVDGEDVLIPMATEESSVVAAVCNAARQCRDSGGFVTSLSGSLMIAQVQLIDVKIRSSLACRFLRTRTGSGKCVTRPTLCCLSTEVVTGTSKCGCLRAGARAPW